MGSLVQKVQTRSILTKPETIYFVENLLESLSSFKFCFDTQVKKNYKLRKYFAINHISKYEKVIVSPNLQEKKGILLNQRA